MKYAVTVYLETNDGEEYYVAEHPELEGCIADGRTEDEALAALDEVRELYIDALRESGCEVPLPISAQMLNALEGGLVEAGSSSPFTEDEPIRSAGEFLQLPPLPAWRRENVHQTEDEDKGIIHFDRTATACEG